MSDGENDKDKKNDESAAPSLPAWKRWLEFSQVLAVLSAAAGAALPFAVGTDATNAWAGFIILEVVGIVLAFVAMFLIPKDAGSPTLETAETVDDDVLLAITSTRLLTLIALHIPEDVIDALRKLQGDEDAWRGRLDEFRELFYSQIGEKRGAQYLQEVTSNLLAYVKGKADDATKPATDAATEAAPGAVRDAVGPFAAANEPRLSVAEVPLK